MTRQFSHPIRLNLEVLEDRDLPSSLGGFVFDDANNNSVKDAGEQGLAGVVVTLRGAEQQCRSVHLTQRTDANGYYNFANLAQGNYTLKEADVSGYIDGAVSVGSLGGMASANSVSRIALGNNVSGTDYNFGELAKSAGWTASAADFHRVPTGSTVWYSSVFKADGISSTDTTTLRFTNQTISYVLNGATVTVAVPDSVVTFSPTATAASTSFDAAANAWVTTLPTSWKGAAFLGGVALSAPNGIKDVTWKGQMSTDTAGVSVKWKWTAEVYSQGGSHTRTCHSHSAKVVPPVVQPPVATTATLSGFVFDVNGVAAMDGIQIMLEDADGNILSTATTNADGSYSFGDLPPGTYQLRLAPPNNWDPLTAEVGTVNGTPTGQVLDSASIGAIDLAAGNNALNYNFFLVLRG